MQTDSFIHSPPLTLLHFLFYFSPFCLSASFFLTTCPFVFLPPLPLTYYSSFTTPLFFRSLTAPCKRLMIGILATSLFFSSVLTGQQSETLFLLTPTTNGATSLRSLGSEAANDFEASCLFWSQQARRIMVEENDLQPSCQQTIQCWSERFSISISGLHEAVSLTLQSAIYSRPS